MSVFLNNLDDFIVPSQACVNPFVSNPSMPSQPPSKTGKITLQADLSYSEFELPAAQPNLIKTKVGSVSEKKVATVSLNDCLACRYQILFRVSFYLVTCVVLQWLRHFCRICAHPRAELQEIT